MASAIVFAFLSAFGFGLAFVFARLGLERVNPVIATLISVTTSFLLTAGLVIILDPNAIRILPLAALLWCFCYGLITFPMARLLNYASINLAGASRAAPIMSVSPIFATMIGVAVLGERLGLYTGLGIVVTAMGMALIVSDRESYGN